MNSFKRIMSGLFLVITALLLGACGGSGGGSDAGIAVPTAPSTPVSINASNAELVSADVLGTVGLIEGFMLVGDLLPAVQVDTVGSEFSYPDFFVQQLRRLPEMDISVNDTIVTGTVIPPTREDCDNLGEGTMTISGDLTLVYPGPEWDPTVGDQITIQYENCELAGIKLNGKISMTLTTVVGDVINLQPPYPITLGLDVVLTVFSVEAGGQIAYANGDMSMLMTQVDLGYETLELWGSSLTAWDNVEVETLTDYGYFFDERSSLPELAYSFELQKGTLASSIIGGAVSFQMTRPGTSDPSVPFLGVDAGDPYEGEVWITTSADTSMVHVTALSNSVDVEIDVWLDGVIVNNIMTTWEHMEQCLLNPADCYTM